MSPNKKRETSLHENVPEIRRRSLTAPWATESFSGPSEKLDETTRITTETSLSPVTIGGRKSDGKTRSCRPVQCTNSKGSVAMQKSKPKSSFVDTHTQTLRTTGICSWKGRQFKIL